jgi:hypothetical protein
MHAQRALFRPLASYVFIVQCSYRKSFQACIAQTVVRNEGRRKEFGNELIVGYFWHGTFKLRGLGANG